MKGLGWLSWRSVRFFKRPTNYGWLVKPRSFIWSDVNWISSFWLVETDVIKNWGFSELRMSKTQQKKRGCNRQNDPGKLSHIHADVKASKEELKSEIQALKSELSKVTKLLNAVWDEVHWLKQKNKDIQDQCNAATRANSKLNEEINTLKNRVINLEDYSRRENLRFYNIPENPGESSIKCSRKVMDVLSKLGADPENTKFHAIRQRGKPDTLASSNNAVGNGFPTESSEGPSWSPRPRPILVRFVSRMDSDWAWENKKKLMNSSRFRMSDARSQHQELHALLFTFSVWVL